MLCLVSTCFPEFYYFQCYVSEPLSVEWCFQFVFGSNTFYFFSSKNKYVILGLPVRIKKNIIFTKFSDVYLVFIMCRCFDNFTMEAKQVLHKYYAGIVYQDVRQVFREF